MVKAGKPVDLVIDQLVPLLEKGNPSIRTRNHLVDEGIIQFDPRELKKEDLPIIAERITNLL